MSETLIIDRKHPEESVLHRAADVVREGGLIVYPTDTLYGIGADATNARALHRVPQSKGRTDRKPILVVADSVGTMRPFVAEIPSVAAKLMERFWPGPLTLVFAASHRVPFELTQGTGTIGIRVPASIVCRKLVALLGVPLSSTSANIAGAEPRRTIGGLQDSLSGIDLFLDAGELPLSEPSTILDVSTGKARLIRKGALPLEELLTIVTPLGT